MSEHRKRDSDSWCKHRTPFGSDYPVCKVGVNFHQFLVPGHCMQDIPCLGNCEDNKAVCPKFEGYTAAELEKQEVESKALLNRIGVIRRAIVASKLRSGHIPCPACSAGVVSFSMASNGHIHARCSTGGCAAWME